MTGRQHIALRMIVMVVTVAVLAGLTASPAAAAWSDCPNGGSPAQNLCFYSAGNGGGTYYATDVVGWPSGTCITLPSNRRNWAVSAWNKGTGTSVDMWTGTGCTGSLITVLNYGWQVTWGIPNARTVDSFRVWPL